MSSSAMTEIHQGDTLPRSASSLCSAAEMGRYDDGLSAFFPVRARLFGIAYRMLGSVVQADDIVQEVWLRWQSADRSVVQNPHGCRDDNYTTVYQSGPIRSQPPRNLYRRVATRTGGHEQ